MDDDKPKTPGEGDNGTEQPESNAENANQNEQKEEVTTEPKLKAAGPDSKSKKPLILLAVLLILAALGAGYWFFLKDDSAPASDQAQTTDEVSQEAEATKKTGDADTVAYAFKADDNANYSVFWRNVLGGDRTEVGPLGAKSFVTHSAVSGSNVAYATDNSFEGTAEKAVWLSTDGGKTYSKAMDISDNTQVTSMLFSVDESELAVALLPNVGESNTVKSINVSSKQSKDLFSSDNAGVFLEGYSTEKKLLIYSEGCFNCDGNLGSPIYKWDLNAASRTEISDAKVSSGYAHTVVRSDFTEILVAEGTLGDGLGMGAPYNLLRIAVADGKVTPVAENVNGLLIGLGYMADNQTPYYALGKQILTAKGAAPTVYFESDKDIVGAYFVSDKEVIVSTGQQSEFVLYRYDVAAKSSKNILNGDGNTTIFGVTSK
jgi:hypothetical protein